MTQSKVTEAKKTLANSRDIRISTFERALKLAREPGSSPEQRVESALVFIDANLDGMVRAPFTWGDPETLEAAAITLLSLRALLLGAEPHDHLSVSYRKILRRRFGERSTGAAGSLHSEAVEETADILGKFIALERKRLKVPSKMPAAKKKRYWKKGASK